MTWFDSLTGFPERSAYDVRSNLRLDGTRLTSLANGRTFDAGLFSTPSLSQLRQLTSTGTGHQIGIKELVGDVQALHQDAGNKHAVFQVASQFNCLEMAAPHITPEDGVGIYENDLTQGPACSISAGGGTIFRNYFADVHGRTGQTRDHQIDCLSEIEHVFSTQGNAPWEMRNGYCLPKADGLAHIENSLANCTPETVDDVRAKLRVGVQSNTQVTTGNHPHVLTQVFCSALPICYSDIPISDWYHFPRLILDATYEATFHVACQNLANTGCNKLYLTLVGGGVFGNKIEWILAAISRSLKMFSWADLDVHVVSYGGSAAEVAKFVTIQNANARD